MGETGAYSTLVYHPVTERPVIAYRNHSDGDALYAWYDGGTWNKETIESAGDVGVTISLAFDPTTNEPSVAYLDGGNDTVRFASRNAGTWSASAINSIGTARYPILTIDSTGIPTIGYVDMDTNILWAARFVGGAWRHERVDGNVSWAFLTGALNSVADQPVLVYTRPNGELVHAQRVAKIPATSTWGLVALTLLLVCAGTITVFKGSNRPKHAT